MVTVGIDIGGRTHVVARCRDGTARADREIIRVSQSRAGFGALDAWLDRQPEPVSLVTMESSGHYWMPVASHLRRRTFRWPWSTHSRRSTCQEPPGPATPGMHREQAIVGDGIWLGTVRTEPHTLTGWHHHGTYDTYIYVLEGSARVDYDEGGFRSVGAEPGDSYTSRPPSSIARAAPGPVSKVSCCGFGEGEVVFNVEGPEVPSDR